MQYRRHSELESKPLKAFESTGATYRQLYRGDQSINISRIELAAGGLIGMHSAPCAQLMMVLHGEIECSVEDVGTVVASSGDEVCFDRGEQHQTRAITSAVLLIMEIKEASD